MNKTYDFKKSKIIAEKVQEKIKNLGKPGRTRQTYLSIKPLNLFDIQIGYQVTYKNTPLVYCSKGENGKVDVEVMSDKSKIKNATLSTIDKNQSMIGRKTIELEDFFTNLKN